MKSKIKSDYADAVRFSLRIFASPPPLKKKGGGGGGGGEGCATFDNCIRSWGQLYEQITLTISE